MMIRGIRVSRWFKQRDIKKLVQGAFPGTSVQIRNVDRARFQIRWTGDASYEDMRTLADEIEAAASAKLMLTIECIHQVWERLPGEWVLRDEVPPA